MEEIKIEGLKLFVQAKTDNMQLYFITGKPRIIHVFHIFEEYEISLTDTNTNKTIDSAKCIDKDDVKVIIERMMNDGK